MSYPPPSWPPSPPPSHSIEVEHRLTQAEERIDRQTERLTLHEKAILALASGLYIVAQERFPAIAGLIREILSK